MIDARTIAKKCETQEHVDVKYDDQQECVGFDVQKRLIQVL
jgi:hypothetical protein